MDRDYIRKLEDKCIQECPPGCRSLCPLHSDVRAMIAAEQKGDFTGALEIYMKAVPFPGILGSICDAPCRAGCVRSDLGGAISVQELEAAALRYGERKERKVRILRKKPGSVAVVGGGLSGLSGALYLYEKGYKVCLYEKESRLGGRVLDYLGDQLSEALLQDDLSVMEKTDIEINCSAVVTDENFPDLADRYSAVLVAAGAKAAEESWAAAIKPDSWFFETESAGIFAAGSCTRSNYSPVLSIAEGKRAALSIDRYLQGVSVSAGRESEGSYESCLFTKTDGIKNEAVVESEGLYFSREEAKKEASRCLLCECMECVKACSLLESYESYPRRYVRELSNSVNQFYGVRKTKHMINGCTDCGLCGYLCPNDLSMGDVCTQGKRELVERGIMPPAIHDFPIRDMLDANSESCSLTTCPENSEYIYFPGCQMQALMPDLLLKSYRSLLQMINGKIALHLGCCGAPADWAARTGLRDDVLEAFRLEWEKCGKPVIIYACTSCRKTLAHIADEAELVSVWEIFDRLLPAESIIRHPDLPVHIAVADSCTARSLPAVRKSVRNLFEKLGCITEELEYNGEKARCCGFGGLVSHAEPDMGKKISRARISESRLDYGVYCVMCREHYTAEKKNSWHLFEYLFGPSEHRATLGKRISWSSRQENRRRLREETGNKFASGLKPAEPEEWERLRLFIGPEVYDRMEERMILVRNIQKLIYDAELSGRKIVDPLTNRITASDKPGIITYWAEYSPENDGFRVHRAYSHRLEIKEQNFED